MTSTYKEPKKYVSMLLQAEPKTPVLETVMIINTANNIQRINHNSLFDLFSSFFLLLFFATILTQIDFDDSRQDHRSLACRSQNISRDRFSGLHPDLHVFIGALFHIPLNRRNKYVAYLREDVIRILEIDDAAGLDIRSAYDFLRLEIKNYTTNYSTIRRQFFSISEHHAGNVTHI